MADIVFEGDEDYTRGRTRAGAQSPVARSPVADFLIRRRVVRSERQARLLAAAIAIFALALALGSAYWASQSLRASPRGKPYAQMTEAERLALPVKQRFYLERLERAKAEARELRARDAAAAED